MRPLATLAVLAVSCCASTLDVRLARAIDAEANSDVFNPAAELYDIAETQRLNNVARQVELTRLMFYSTWYAPGDLWGPPIGGPPIEQPIGYESEQVGPNRWIYRPRYAESELLPTPGGAAGGEPRPELPAPRDARPEDFVPPAERPNGDAHPAAQGRRAF
jgi:hypothetical protein